MTFKPKAQSFNPAVLPMEFSPRVLDAADDKHARHYLIPGKIFAAAQPFAISTIVGTGVALCLWDSENRIGGANHFILPEGPEDSVNATRYANVANPALLQRMCDLGAHVNALEARIFGGSLPGVTFSTGGDCLGDRNVHAVTHFLKMNGIRLVQSEVGGTHGRKLVFQTDDGRAWSDQL
ncbi:MAG TPA: chemotaxis protein CheD [Candidatus Dormibacteraeota bacterium]|nr:chemotaxis protein CheD [Candidatus Dormibacteraeota bacterium]